VLGWARGGRQLRVDLVLLHENKSRMPAGTRAWLGPRSVAMHHHLQRDSCTDVERLARLLTGRSVGLVLGGGGARGFAHIGVIRAMHEAGIPIDLVGGTSIGACIGAQYAMGLDWPAMLELNRKGFIDLNPMADYTLPIVALLNAAKFEKMFSMMFGETRLEDLWLSYYCISTNLTRGETVVHERGSVRKYVRASMSVPGMAPPVPDNGCLLVDGGVLNNLPAETMRRMCGNGYVIAVDVNPSVDLAATVDYGQSLSGWSAAWRQLNPLGPRLRLPTIQAILERTTAVSSVQQAQVASALVDLYLHAPIEGFGMFEVAALDRIADVGYRWAQSKLAQWKRGRSF
jgi:predicted acylesterase/phospholipase RssA